MKYFTVFFSLFFIFDAFAQKQFEIDANVAATKLYSDHLQMTGSNPKGETISVNNYYISINDKPIIPVTGEFHFSRYASQYWDESIRKMKAGGITIIATYVFWNLHEEQQGRFDWSGDKNLRHFIELCRKNNIYVIVRIGPFCHGEIRNGGLPDWLMGKPLTIRSNDPQYLQYVEKFYNETGKQLQGLLFKNGGPIIGIQIENEYQHSAAPWGLTYPGQPLDMTAAERDLNLTQAGVGISKESNPYADLGKDHMKILKSLAIKAGLVVPIYTATGWGNAAIVPNETIPVTAAYAYPFWTPKRDYSPFFLYKDMHSNPDYAPVRYEPGDYPVFAAELGSGIMSVYTRRPIAEHKSLDAMINRCLGSGANGIGYYMYHGGSTPKGRTSFMSDEAYGLPKISYDFQAPIGEYGQVREGFHRLKLLHFFLKDFGDILAPMQTVLPSNAAAIKPDNISDLRYAVRVKGNSGFLFLNNFQDDTTMPDQKNIQVRIKTPAGDVLIPANGGFDLKSGENAMFPFNFFLNGAQLVYATAQLLMKCDDKTDPYYVFFSPGGVKSEFLFAAGTQVQTIAGASIDNGDKGSLVTCDERISQFVIVAGNKKTKVLVIDKDLALTGYIVPINGKKHLVLSDAIVFEVQKGFEFLSDGNNSFEVIVYPMLSAMPKVATGRIAKVDGNPAFSSYRVTLPLQTFTVKSRKISDRKWAVDLPQELPQGVNDIFLKVDYTGDTGMAFLDGELVADEFYKGISWQIGLRKFINPGAKEMVFYFRPMQKNASYLVDLQPYPQSIPDFGNAKTFLKVNSFTLTPQYKTTLTF